MIAVARWTRCLGADHTDSETTVARWTCVSGFVNMDKRNILEISYMEL